MTDVTHSPNFYIGRSADVGDMLLHGQVVSGIVRDKVTRPCLYALCLLYIVMCAILRVVAYFLSVNLLPMYTVFVALCVAHFPVKE